MLGAPQLATDEYANYVLQRLLRGSSNSSSPPSLKSSTGEGTEAPPSPLLSAADRRAVARGLLGRARELSTHVSGSNVLEAVLGSCGREERRALLAELLPSPSASSSEGDSGGEGEKTRGWSLEKAMAHPYGNYVLQRALLVADADQRVLLSSAVVRAEPRLRSSPHGRHLLARVEELSSSAAADGAEAGEGKEEAAGGVAVAASAPAAPVSVEAEGAEPAAAKEAAEEEEEHDGAKEDAAPLPAAFSAATAATTTKPPAPVSYAAAVAAAAATSHPQARAPLVAAARAQQQQC